MAEFEVLMKGYENLLMLLADACLVRMSELISGSLILTLDSDFRIYWKNRNEAIDLIIPVVLWCNSVWLKLLSFLLYLNLWQIMQKF